MPYVHIRVTDEGVTPEQKQTLIFRTTQLLKDVLNKNPATTFVVIEEVPTDNWGVAGEAVTRRRAESQTERLPTNQLAVDKQTGHLNS